MRIPLQIPFALVVAVASTAMAQPPACTVKHQPFVEGGIARGQMRLTNNGNGCEVSFKFGGKFDPSDWKVENAPKHGRLEMNNSIVKYFPDAGYVGTDSFSVAVFGYNPMLRHGHRARDGRFAFNVQVRPPG